MSAEPALAQAADRLRRSLDQLGVAIDRQLSREDLIVNAEAELQRMTADRGRLAGELDAAVARSERLEQANREVSRRLVAAMETIRAVLDRQKQG
ncbi:DUF4164 domain-containing protein [Mangrovibrevibacter kandeliae]|uniref:DUF4164 domain-containing protein n=1 Tax=Mangrovibrevibacter kandeliae TaxID=2968473 RepID=UPI0021196C42|nr:MULTISPECIES: DUF4164 domain-containing protein [unclassified Aurantimonas]MCQ8784210.1 DUF4164 domain-containing protein [Aurantimonas sp. CSK15Z-1]MCW4116948.1 DUF4164 domain-containing protein [Aurantimonas sp. MSK8Z-1]